MFIKFTCEVFELYYNNAMLIIKLNSSKIKYFCNFPINKLKYIQHFVY